MSVALPTPPDEEVDTRYQQLDQRSLRTPETTEFTGQTPSQAAISIDRSSDRTLAILESFAKHAPFDVRLFRNDRSLGYAQNFSRALSLCSGELVFLSDQDDVWLENKIKIIEEIALSDESNQVFMNDAALTWKDLTPTGLTKLGQIWSAGLSESDFVMGCCAAVRAPFLASVLPVPSGYPAHDSWIVGFADGLRRRRLIERSLQLYRRHVGSVSAFAANRPTALGKMRYALGRLRANIGSDYFSELRTKSRHVHLMRDRADALLRTDNDHEGWMEDLPRFIHQLDERRGAMQKRIELLGRRRLERVWPVAKMVWRGEYRYFNGTWTALQDCLL